MCLGAFLAVQARDEFWDKHVNKQNEAYKPLVAGSIGPYGAHLADGSEYTGNYIDDLTQDVRIFAFYLLTEKAWS